MSGKSMDSVKITVTKNGTRGHFKGNDARDFFAHLMVRSEGQAALDNVDEGPMKEALKKEIELQQSEKGPTDASFHS